MAGMESSQMPVNDEALPAAIPSSSTAPAGPDRAAPDARAAHGAETRGQSTGAKKDPTCPGCNSTGARNLVVCIDGTSNQFSTKNTNVVELYSRLIKDEKQLTFYNSGIGTYAKPSWKSWSYRKQVIANKLDLAFALRLEKIIISAYAWLVDHYQPGDRIFLFGFSRGAYQVRALAAMIDIVGLLHKGNNDQIAFAYELYAASGAEEHQTAQAIQPPRSRRSPTLRWMNLGASAPESASSRGRFVHAVRSLASRVLPRTESGDTVSDYSDLPPLGDDRIMSAVRVLASRVLTQREKPRPKFPQPKRIEPRLAEQTRDGPMAMQKQFKRTFSRDVHVHFVGAWDTVSSVGLVRDKTLPATTEGMKFVCFFRHALALHEYRVKFLPEYANGGDGPDSQETQRNGCDEPHTKEVWFTGSHSDIGGGSTANTTLDKFGPALRWMSWEATLAGLRLDNNPTRWEKMGVSSSMTAVWRIIECLPIKHMSYKDTTKKRQWFSAGTVTTGQAISPIKQPVTRRPHFSENRSIKPGQRIHRSVYDECGDFVQPELVEIEADDYIEAKDLLRPPAEVLQSGHVFDTRNTQRLGLLTSSAQGIQSLRELDLFQYIYDLSQSCRNSEGEAQILEDLLSLYAAYVKGLFGDVPHTGAIDKISDLSPSETFPFHLCGHTRLVSSVAFLSDTRVVSGSWDKTLRIWDVRTGKMTLGSPLSGHSKVISRVAVDAAKGLVASASSDSTIRLWTSDSNGAVHTGKVLQDESSDRVLAVAFCPDGSHLVSGSNGGAIRVWNAAAGERVGEPVPGHTNGVRSVAFSPDGNRIVSGSDDHTMQLWEWSPDEATLQPCGEPLNGHSGSVLSVAFSLDARVIASGSGDKTVRIWDVATRTSKFTLKAHTDYVNSVAFAPSGTHVVSGSHDWTVRIWDARTGTAVRVLRGHTDMVWSVAFSPDGTRIASGARDRLFASGTLSRPLTSPIPTRTYNQKPRRSSQRSAGRCDIFLLMLSMVDVPLIQNVAALR